MLGAITGDIIGSIYEFNNIKTKNFNLFTDKNYFTDDTVMSFAVAEALMNGSKSEDFIRFMKRYGVLYPRVGYGGTFFSWLFSDTTEPYNSWGNGSAMRVSPCGWVAKLSEPFEEGLKLTEDLAKKSAEVTHNHPEGIKGAQATAAAIFFMRHGKSKNAIEEYKNKLKDYIQNKYQYDLDFILEEIRPIYKFDVSCQGSLPPALVSFLESENFEDAIRNAISIGGDSDTLGAITGSIAEAAYGIPEDIKNKAINYLDNRLKGVYENWINFLESLGNKI
ncbi:ADP-ribosylglycohydrolase family protein [uncultured Brachyspira sp.]|uniref:ADP-ribosylglycohydrolase family protein n=1 Tax=uncultured Brachyspira sp. TaxID=221953 RepID=UPI0025897FC9|nr:ADP-ribosylglycohydrolase family protein [uncultured Brachyspira sp.]